MIHEKHQEWLTDRGLDPVLAEKLGIATTRDGSGFWLTVPYVHKGETVIALTRGVPFWVQVQSSAGESLRPATKWTRRQLP